MVRDELPRYLLHDRDDKYPRSADSLLRQECLDRIIILNQVHLRWVLEEYVRYYNERRPHRSLQHLPPEALPEYLREGEITRRPVLGGIINDYDRLAA